MKFSHLFTFVAIFCMMILKKNEHKILSTLFKAVVIPCTYGIPMIHLIYLYRKAKCGMDSVLSGSDLSSLKNNSFIHAMAIIEISYFSCWILTIILWLIKYKIELKFKFNHNPYKKISTNEEDKKGKKWVSDKYLDALKQNSKQIWE